MKFPTLKLHKPSGVYFTFWDNRRHYFSTSEAASRTAYLAHLDHAYLPWAQARELSRARLRANGFSTRPLMIVDLAHLWLQDVADRRRHPETIGAYRRVLAPLLHAFGELPAKDFHASHLAAIRKDLAGVWSGKTLNHMVNAVKMMFAWADDTERIPAPIRLRAVKLIELEPPNPLVYTPRQVAQFIERARTEWANRGAAIELLRRTPATSGKRPRGGNPLSPAEFTAIGIETAAWMSVQYLTAARPSDLLRLVHRQCKEVDVSAAGTIVRMETGKTTRRTQAPRHLLLTPEALEHLRVARAVENGGPRWKRLDGFSHAVQKALGPAGLPHHLRHSAATELSRQGAAQEEVQIILGHASPGMLRNYVQTARERLLPRLAQLSLRSAHEGSRGTPKGPAAAADEEFWGS